MRYQARFAIRAEMPIFEAMPQTHRIARAVARAFVRDMRAFHAAGGTGHKADAIAAQQLQPTRLRQRAETRRSMALDDFGELGRPRCDIRRLRRLVTKLLSSAPLGRGG